MSISPRTGKTAKLNVQIDKLKPSATLHINELSNKMIAEGKEVFKLGLGQSPFPVPDSVQEALQHNTHQKAYLPVQGLYALREAVAAYHLRQDQLHFTAEQVMIGPGSKELLFILQLVLDCDLLIPAPSWVSYAPQAQIVGKSVHWLQTEAEAGWRLTADVLEEHASSNNRPALLILNYPNNPIGNTYDKEALRKLAIVAQKHGIIILSDEIYGELHVEGEHTSIAKFYPEGTIVSAGLSKWCGAGGWRLGTFSFPHELEYVKKAMCVVASETFTSVSAPIQYAAIRAYQGGEDIEKYVQGSRRILKALGNFISDKLLAANISHPRPEGGFYLFVNFEFYRKKLATLGIKNSATLCNHILQETGVAMLPGNNFGRPEEELTVRLAFVNFDGKKVLSALSQLADDQPVDERFLKQYCPRTIEAITRVCSPQFLGQ